MEKFQSIHLLTLALVLTVAGTQGVSAQQAQPLVQPLSVGTTPVVTVQDPVITELLKRIAALEKKNEQLERQIVSLGGNLTELARRVATFEADTSSFKQSVGKALDAIDGHTHAFKVRHFDSTSSTALYEHMQRGVYVKIPTISSSDPDILTTEPMNPSH